MTLGLHIVKMVVLTLVFGVCSLALNAQLNYDYTAGKFLIKGRVVDLGTQAPVPMANIRILNTHKGLTCETDGSFTMYVSKKDTLEFSSTGYVTRAFCVGDFDSSQYYVLNIELLHDFIKLKEVTIYPFKDVDDFKTAFIGTKDQNKLLIPGIAAPKYSNITPKAKFSNPISYWYDRLKKKGTADPDFKP
jgi:hypothetical protein